MCSCSSIIPNSVNPKSIMLNDASNQCIPINKNCTNVDDKCCTGLICKPLSPGHKTCQATTSCIPKGKPCEATSNCCPTLICDNTGTCNNLPPPPPPCVSINKSCKKSTSKCCDGLACKPTSINDSTCVPTCARLLQNCNNVKCCVGLECHKDDHICQIPVTCANLLQNCVDKQCCEGLECNEDDHLCYLPVNPNKNKQNSLLLWISLSIFGGLFIIIFMWWIYIRFFKLSV